MKKMSGIEPIIAVVILVAVTLVIAIGVIGWFMGWWGGVGQVETLVLHPDSKLYADGTIVLHVENKGTAAAVIYKVEVVGVKDTTDLTLPDGSVTSAITLAPGKDIVFTANIGENLLTAGASYVVRVYTKAGNMYPITLRAEA
jgi:hypothetical protein